LIVEFERLKLIDVGDRRPRLSGERNSPSILEQSFSPVD
jgi:hypothetical protein